MENNVVLSSQHSLMFLTNNYGYVKTQEQAIDDNPVKFIFHINVFVNSIQDW